MGLTTQLPASWTDRKFVGSTPRRLATPSTGSPPTADLTRRLKDLQDTPPPALLPPIRLFHGPALDTPMLAEEVASRNIIEEERGEGLAGAEQAGGGLEAEEALEEEMAGGGEEAEGRWRRITRKGRGSSHPLSRTTG